MIINICATTRESLLVGLVVDLAVRGPGSPPRLVGDWVDTNSNPCKRGQNIKGMI